MFGEPGTGFFESWSSFILYAAVLFSVIWLFFKFLETKAGKSVNNGVSTSLAPILRWYENLSYNIRNFVGWVAIMFYCLSIIALFIILES